jgi:hypothetical protein
MGKECIAVPDRMLATTGPVSQITQNPRELAAVIEYRLAEMMGMAGFSYKAIMRTLGMNSSEVKYRLHRLGVRVRAYRDGETPLAKQVIGRLDEVAQKRLVDNLEKFLLK